MLKVSKPTISIFIINFCLSFLGKISLVQGTNSEHQLRTLATSSQAIQPYIPYCNNYQPTVLEVTNHTPVTLSIDTPLQVSQINCVNYYSYEIQPSDLSKNLLIEMTITSPPNKPYFNPLLAYKFGAYPNIYYHNDASLGYDWNAADLNGKFIAHDIVGHKRFQSIQFFEELSLSFDPISTAFQLYSRKHNVKSLFGRLAN